MSPDNPAACFSEFCSLSVELSLLALVYNILCTGSENHMHGALLQSGGLCLEPTLLCVGFKGLKKPCALSLSKYVE